VQPVSSATNELNSFIAQMGPSRQEEEAAYRRVQTAAYLIGIGAILLTIGAILAPKKLGITGITSLESIYMSSRIALIISIIAWGDSRTRTRRLTEERIKRLDILVPQNAMFSKLCQESSKVLREREEDLNGDQDWKKQKNIDRTSRAIVLGMKAWIVMLREMRQRKVPLSDYEVFFKNEGTPAKAYAWARTFTFLYSPLHHGRIGKGTPNLSLLKREVAAFYKPDTIQNGWRRVYNAFAESIRDNGFAHQHDIAPWYVLDAAENKTNGFYHPHHAANEI